MANFAADPAVKVNGLEVASVRPAGVNESVKLPAVPEIFKFVNVAIPAEAVAEGVPTNTPPEPVVIVAATTAAQAAGLKAGDLVRSASAVLGGGGGGKPDLAQGGGTDPAKFNAALAAIAESIG
jgi:alanyl-tRNA synthetase